MARSPWALSITAALVLLAVACGSSAGTEAGDGSGAPSAVIDSAARIEAVAQSGDPVAVAALAADGFELDLARPDVALVEHLTADDGEALRALVLVLATVPGRRQSPIGNGAVQELWVYPALALQQASEWTESQVDQALGTGLFSPEALADYRAADAYLGYSVGITPEGEWLFFTAGRVARTPR